MEIEMGFFNELENNMDVLLCIIDYALGRHNPAGKDIVYRADPTQPLTLRPHMFVGSAGMSLCFVQHLKRGHCWPLIRRISL